ncbi:MAG TPA: site-2 protease family protein, partial [Tepidisphaeraceae bacterium]|nr:site-2 protease family protein [Tepidisphaeraceae bacterium]
MTDLPDPALLLQQLSSDAMRLEQRDPAAAVARWRQALTLLPPGSPAHAAVSARIRALQGGGPESGGVPIGEDQMMPEGSAGAQPVHYRQPPPLDPMPVAVAKTLGSMVVSIGCYYWLFKDSFPTHDLALWFSVGFVVLMLIHEMGHVFATWYYKLSASPPIFIPFMGALINLRESPPNALVESIIGIGGPVLGTVGAIACLCLAITMRNPVTHDLLLNVAEWGFFLNLFNLIPVPPLDGGRVTAAVSPWIWMLGIIGMGGLIVYFWMHGGTPWLMIIIFFYALPRIKETLRRRG